MVDQAERVTHQSNCTGQKTPGKTSKMRLLDRISNVSEQIYKLEGGFPGASVVKELASAGAIRGVYLIPGSRRFPGGGNGNPLQYSCLENPTDRGVWRATIHGVAKSWTQIRD